MARILAGTLACLLCCVAAAEGKVCAPEAMLKVVSALDVPGMPAGHFARVPKTLYRSGSKYGRLEEAYNAETSFELLVVVSEPHLWMANLVDRTGRYVLDPGPTYYFRAPIFGDGPVRSAFIRALEVGCETLWLEQAGAKASRIEHPKLGRVRSLEYSEGAERLVLYERSGRPLRLELSQDGKAVFALDYLEYLPGLKLDQRLFEKPAGITFSVDRQAAP